MKIVGGALYNAGKLLVVKRTPERVLWPNLWEIPGGRVEKGETDEKALRREFEEETGLKVEVFRHYHQFEYSYDGVAAVENDFIVTSSSGYKIRLDPREHTEYRWVSRDDLKSLEISPDMRKSIETSFILGT
jgi:mutator protein MutT